MLICITNRKLCDGDFLNRIEEIARAKPHAIMLREKDMSLTDYETLAVQVKAICDRHAVNLIINQKIEIAETLQAKTVQLSINDLRKYEASIKKWKCVGVSVHSVEQAKEAEERGAHYLIAGHIFPTDSKKGLPPRGLCFLQAVCHAVTIPVFAIGGINKANYKIAVMAGATGICVMSEAMTCQAPKEMVECFAIPQK